MPSSPIVDLISTDESWHACNGSGTHFEKLVLKYLKMYFFLSNEVKYDQMVERRSK